MKKFITKAIEISIHHLNIMGYGKNQINKISKNKTSKELLFALLDLENKCIDKSQKILSYKFDNYKGPLNKSCFYFDKDNLDCILEKKDCKQCNNFFLDK